MNIYFKISLFHFFSLPSLHFAYHICSFRSNIGLAYEYIHFFFQFFTFQNDSFFFEGIIPFRCETGTNLIVLFWFAEITSQNISRGKQ